MRATKTTESALKIAVDVKELQNMLSCGEMSAVRIGESAGAIIRIGRRKLYNVKKVEEYLDKLAEG